MMLFRPANRRQWWGLVLACPLLWAGPKAHAAWDIDLPEVHQITCWEGQAGSGKGESVTSYTVQIEGHSESAIAVNNGTKSALERQYKRVYTKNGTASPINIAHVVIFCRAEGDTKSTSGDAGPTKIAVSVHATTAWNGSTNQEAYVQQSISGIDDPAQVLDPPTGAPGAENVWWKASSGNAPPQNATFMMIATLKIDTEAISSPVPNGFTASATGTGRTRVEFYPIH
jgi:hypothetical protein